MLRKIPIVVAFAALFTLGVVLGAACGDDDDAGAQDGVSEERITEIETRLSRTQVLTGLIGLGAIPWHAIDEDIQTASEIPEDYEFEVAGAQEILAAIDWPEDLQESADAFIAAVDAFAAAIENGDLEAAKGAATDSHDTFHELEHAGYHYAAGEEPHDEEEDEGDDHDESATETPEG